MTDPAALNPAAADDDPNPLDRAAALIEPQLRLLGRLAEIGVELAEAIVVQAKDAAAPRVCQGDLGLAYTRVSRAVRQALMLQSKLIETLAALDAAEAAIDPFSPQADPDYQIKARVERVITRTAQAQHEDDDDSDEAIAAVDRLIADAGERLDDIDLYGDLLERPMSEIVARIARDIGLPLDWTRLAQEAWAQAEMQGDEVGAPLAALRDTLVARPPPVTDLDGPDRDGPSSDDLDPGWADPYEAEPQNADRRRPAPPALIAISPAEARGGPP